MGKPPGPQHPAPHATDEPSAIISGRPDHKAPRVPARGKEAERQAKEAAIREMEAERQAKEAERQAREAAEREKEAAQAEVERLKALLRDRMPPANS